MFSMQTWIQFDTWLWSRAWCWSFFLQNTADRLTKDCQDGNQIYETTHYCHEKNQTEAPYDTMMPQKKVKNRSGNCCILGLLGMFWHAHLSITWRIPGEQAGKKIARAYKNDQKHGFHWIYTEDFYFQHRVWILQIQSVILVILVSKLRTCWPDGPGQRKKTRAPQSLSSGCPLWGT